MNKPPIIELGTLVCKQITKFFETEENRNKFDEWYFQTYGKHYDWKTKGHPTPLRIE